MKSNMIEQWDLVGHIYVQTKDFILILSIHVTSRAKIVKFAMY